MGRELNQKPEDLVKKSCLNRLDLWCRKGIVIDYDDVSGLGKKQTRYGWVMHTKKGKRDLLAIINCKGMAWIYLVEVKAPDGGNWSAEQRLYAKRFDGIENCFYEVVTHPNQIDNTIARIAKQNPEDLLPDSL